MTLIAASHRVVLITVGTGLLLAAACAEASQPIPIEGTTWRVVTVEEGGATLTPASSTRPATLTFTDEVVQDGVRRRLSGSSGCNNLSGSYRTALPDSIRVSALATTRMACPPASAEFELRLTRALTEVTRVTVTGSEMEMTHAGVRIVLTAPGPADPTD